MDGTEKGMTEVFVRGQKVAVESPELAEFLQATERLCGEADDAARFARQLFSGPDQESVLRSLARCMHLVDLEIYRVVESKYPGVIPDVPE